VIRLACLLVLVALALAVVLAIRPTGPNAILFSFVGVPALAAGILVFGVRRWRDGAFSSNRSSI
jgi:peptidoglycan/LPS O-acetylase OafA/YrhL